MKRTLAVIAVAAAAIIAAVIWLPLGAWIKALVGWIQGFGALGVIVFSVAFLGLAVLMVPTAELYIGAGLAYGMWWGTLLTTVLSVIADLIVMAIAHTTARKWIERRSRSRYLRALDRGVAQHSLSIPILLRMSPLVPFGALNYALAAAKLPVWRHIVTNVIGMLPSNFVLAYAGSILTSVAQLGSSPPGMLKYVALGVGLAATIVATVLTVRVTRRAAAS